MDCAVKKEVLEFPVVDSGSSAIHGRMRANATTKKKTILIFMRTDNSKIPLVMSYSKNTSMKAGLKFMLWENSTSVASQQN
jgi:hypothetical protein